MTCNMKVHIENHALQVKIVGGTGGDFELGVNALKSVPGARYDPSSRSWVLPRSSGCAAGLIKTVTGLGAGFAVEIADDVTALARRHALRTAICSDPSNPNYTGPLKGWVDPPGQPLWEHQRVGARIIAVSDGCYLTHDMRTGKTRTVIVAIKLLGTKRALILCPQSVGKAWVKEWRECAQPAESLLNLCAGKVAERVKALNFAIKHNRQVVAVLNYDVLHIEAMQKALLAAGFELIVADEAQRIKAVKGKGSKFMELIRDRTPRRVALSGTPIQSSPEDLFGQMRFVDPFFFGTSHTRFLMDYAYTGGNSYALSWRNQDRLHQLFKMASHRVRRSDVMELPPMTDEVYEVQLSATARNLYNEIESNFLVEVEGVGELTVDSSLKQMLYLQEITSGFLKTPDSDQWHKIDSGKRDALREIIEGLAPTEPVVIFCRFKSDMAAAHEVARELGRLSLELSGSRKELEQWQASDDAPPILVVQEQSGGVGIDLTRASYQIFFSTGWSFGQHDQARARMQGVRQKRSVHCIYLVVLDTIDELVHRSITRKSREAADIVEHKHETRQIIDVMRSARRTNKSIGEVVAQTSFFGTNE